MCEEKFYKPSRCKGGVGMGGGGGGRRTGLRKVKAQITIVRGSPNRVTLMKFKGLLRYQKPHVTDYISIYVLAYNVLYADSLYCYLYSNIRYNIQCRITNFLHSDRDSMVGSHLFYLVPTLISNNSDLQDLAKCLLFWERDLPSASSLLSELKQWQRFWKL